MTPDEAIAKLRGLPEDKQRQVLAALGPDERKDILGKLTAPEQPKPEARTVGNYLKEGAEGIGRGLKGDVLGALQMATKPRETASQFAVQAMGAPVMAKKAFDAAPGTLPQRFAAGALTGLENAPVLGPMVQHAEQGGDVMGSPEAFGAALEGTTSFMAPELLGKGIARVVPKIPDAVRAATGTGSRTVGELVKKTGVDNAAETARARVEREKTLAANKAADEKTLFERGKVDENNAALGDKNASGQSEAEQVKKQVARRGEAQKELEQVASDMDVAVEKARHDALAEGNKKYSGVNGALNGIPADHEAIGAAIGDAENELRGSTRDTTLLKDMAREYIGEDGRTPTYEDLQGEYSRLGRELSKGTLPGDVFHAYDQLHEAIGKEMQRIADERGVGGDLKAAREYWRRMKQTFGKSSDTINNRAAKAVSNADPKLLRRQAQEYQIRLLSSFDQKIGEMAKRAADLRSEISSLPKQESALAAGKRLDYAEPHANKPVEKPNLKKVGEDEVKSAKLKSLQKSADFVRYKGSWVAASPFFYILKDVVHGNVGGIPDAVGGGAAILGGAHAIASLLENPKVSDFLTRATPADVAQIPPDLRGDFPSIVQAAQKQGIKVSPALIQLARAGAVVGQTKKRVAAALQAK